MKLRGNWYYDRFGKPIDSVEEYARLHGDREYIRVALDELPGGIEVSTVWLGVDHGFGRGGKPLIFETMVFGGNENDEYTERYSTEAEALEGHKRIVEKVKGRR